MQENLPEVLSTSIGSEKLTDALVTAGDATLDVAVTAFHGVPVLGILAGIYKAQRSVGDILFERKIIVFLQNLNSTSEQNRKNFISKLTTEGKIEQFGETVLTILDKVEDTIKPGIIGRIMAAHMIGHLAYADAMRLVSIISKAYTSDLEYLKTFKAGVQSNQPVAEALFSIGLISNGGFDGGGIDQSKQPGGVVYKINEFGQMLLDHGIKSPPSRMC